MVYTMKTFNMPSDVPRTTITSFMESIGVDAFDLVGVTMTADTVTIEFNVYNRDGELVVHRDSVVTASLTIPIS